jgi:transcriptional regulator with XRE-family HTH domain
VNIKRYRQNTGYTQKRLAEELGISPNFLSDVETGKKWMAFPTLIRMANIFQIEVYELLKPAEAAQDDIDDLLAGITTECLDTIATSFRQSVEQAVKQRVIRYLFQGKKSVLVQLAHKLDEAGE